MRQLLEAAKLFMSRNFAREAPGCDEGRSNELLPVLSRRPHYCNASLSAIVVVEPLIVSATLWAPNTSLILEILWAKACAETVLESVDVSGPGLRRTIYVQYLFSTPAG